MCFGQSFKNSLRYTRFFRMVSGGPRLSNVIGLLVQIFFLVFLGMFLRRKGLLSNEFQANLSVLITNIILPFSILSSSNQAFDTSMLKTLLIAVGVTVGYYLFALGLGLGLGKKIFPSNRQKSGLFATCTTFANVGFLGFPVINTIFGSSGMIYAVLYNMLYNVFFYTIGTSLINTQETEVSIKPSRLLRDPAILSSIIAITIYVSPLRFPALVYNTFQMIGDMITPLSMFLIGASLVGSSIKYIFSNKPALLTSALRLVVLPFLIYLVSLLFPEHQYVFSVLIILTALPVGSMNTIFAKLFHSDVDFASTVTIQSMLLMIITLPLWLLLLL